jgi:hypothetical protein
VCAECKRILAAPVVEMLTERDMLDQIPVARAVASPLDELAQASRAPRRASSTPRRSPGQTVCPICGAVGSLYRRQKANMGLAVFLLIFFFPAWIIYRAFTAGQALYCRSCGAKVADV